MIFTRGGEGSPVFKTGLTNRRERGVLVKAAYSAFVIAMFILAPLLVAANTGHTEPQPNPTTQPTTYRDLSTEQRHRASLCEDLGCIIAIWGSPVVSDTVRDNFAELIDKTCTALSVTLEPPIKSIKTAKEADAACPKYERQVADQLKKSSGIDLECFILGNNCGVIIVISTLYSKMQATQGDANDAVATMMRYLVAIAKGIKLPNPLLERLDKINKAVDRATCPADFGLIASAVSLWYEDSSREIDGAKTTS
jgi:hypothetical protein